MVSFNISTDTRDPSIAVFITSFTVSLFKAGAAAGATTRAFSAILITLSAMRSTALMDCCAVSACSIFNLSFSA